MKTPAGRAESTAPFDAWVPGDYLRDYYREVEPDEIQAIRFFVDASRTGPVGPAACFGAGPALHHVFLAAPRATALYLTDYLPANLAEIDRWLRRQPGAHDWTPFVRYTLRCEGAADSQEAVAAREDLVRRLVSGLSSADAGDVDPMGAEYRGFFSLVLSAFCADSATDDRATWVRYMRNIASLVAPGGLFLTSALRKCAAYKVGDRYFPSANVDASDLRAVLELDFAPESILVETRDLPEHQGQGYSGILLARATRRP